MDYSKVVEELQPASLFDLYRLQVAIGDMLQHPQGITAIREQLKVGQRIIYFDAVENREIAATVIKLNRTRLLVEHERDKQRWTIPFYYVNLEGRATEIETSSRGLGLDKSQLKLGDRVGFLDEQNNDLYGEVVRLNQKTATVILENETQWRVPYRWLHLVIEGEGMTGAKLIRGEVLIR